MAARAPPGLTVRVPPRSASPSLAVPRLAPYSPSRSPSPSPSPSPIPRYLLPEQPHRRNGKQREEIQEVVEVAAGLLSDEEYAKVLPKWRATLRLLAVRSLRREMPYLEWIQTFRTPGRDVYFVKTSLLGTHSMYLISIPLIFWFGHGRTGRGLLYVLAAGGYLTSVLKDLLCIPRPFAPPLHRLSVGNHAAEYGFPSTHSTNSLSIALYFAELLYRYTSLPLLLNIAIHVVLVVVTLSVVLGRLYTGMHSMVDVSVGSIIGALIWVVYWGAEDVIEAFTVSEGWIVTATVVPTTLLLVFVHPAPVEDCPCFEDAVAFVSTAAGILLGRNWCTNDWTHSTYGHSLPSSPLYPLAILTKLISGVLIIFTWRIVAKELSHLALPPLFRFFSPYIIPRRHYVVATEYDEYVDHGIHPVPSLLDLPLLEEVESETDDPIPVEGLKGKSSEDAVRVSVGERKGSMRRDADVLTKVIVYVGIGWLATVGIPWLFVRVGLSV